MQVGKYLSRHHRAVPGIEPGGFAVQPERARLAGTQGTFGGSVMALFRGLATIPSGMTVSVLGRLRLILWCHPPALVTSFTGRCFIDGSSGAGAPPS